MTKLATILILIAPWLSAESPKVDLLTYRTSTLCNIEGADCLSMFTDVRLLRITAPGATAYQVQIVTTGANGERRTWDYVVQRSERRYGKLADTTSATFFVIPIDIAIPILDIWVSALSISGDPLHLAGPGR